jgi:hypothetical protein
MESRRSSFQLFHPIIIEPLSDQIPINNDTELDVLKKRKGRNCHDADAALVLQVMIELPRPSRVLPEPFQASMEYALYVRPWH